MNETENSTQINYVNYSTTEIPYQNYEFRFETYLVPVIFGIIFIVGVLGNGTLVVVFLRHRAMRNVPNTYILSLALADLLVIITTVPFVSIVCTLDSWPWGESICMVSKFVKDVSIGVSVFTLTALSSDRFFAIVDPLRKFHAHGGGKLATCMTITTAIVIWILAIICGIPALAGSNIKHIVVNSRVSFEVCYPFPPQWGPEYAKGMVLFRFLIYYAVPLILIGIFYIMIAIHLVFTSRVPGEIQGAMRQDLVCDRRWMGAIAQSLYMLGVFTGAVTLGGLADKVRRKAVFCWSAVAFIPEYFSFLAVRFLYGSEVSYICGFVLTMELVGPSYRTPCGIAFQATFATGIMRVAGWGALILDRQILQMVYGLHALLLVAHCPNSNEDYNTFWHILRIIGFCLSFANSCANPILLYCVSGAFRKHFNRYLLCKGSSSSRRRNADNLAYRDTSLTSTISRKYPSKRLGNRSCRIQETTITIQIGGTGMNGIADKEHLNRI